MIIIFVLLGLRLVHSWFPTEYPQYCFQNTSTNEIPSLTTAQMAKVSRLKQVQVMVRHGARTPYGNNSCWANYDVQWNNCNVTELMLPSNSYISQVRSSPWLFRKLYDGSPNELGGNCLTGQLIGQGYEQHRANGEFLFQQYLNNQNSLLNLFPTNQWDLLNSSSEVYLRSDDLQRTLMSGQTLMSAFFNVSGESEVPWHTGDYDLDQIYPNTNVCPMIDTMGESIVMTPEFIAENTSVAQVTLNHQLNIIFGEGMWTWGNVQDCMMSTVCTGREMPDGNAEEGAVMSQLIFNNTNDQATWMFTYGYLYNDSQLAKLITGNVAWQVRINIEAMLNGGGMTSAGNVTTPLKLVLFSGHDNTLMPFLAAVLKSNWDQQWAAYAAMVTIELYDSAADPDSLDPSDDLFRIVYNGVPQTVPGCDDTLCGVNVLLSALSFGEEFMPGCAVPSVEPVSDDDDVDCSSDSGDGDLSTTYWILIVVLSLLVGFGGGAGAVYFTTPRATRGDSKRNKHDEGERDSVQMSPIQEQHIRESLSPRKSHDWTSNGQPESGFTF